MGKIATRQQDMVLGKLMFNCGSCCKASRADRANFLCVQYLTLAVKCFSFSSARKAASTIKCFLRIEPGGGHAHQRHTPPFTPVCAVAPDRRLESMIFTSGLLTHTRTRVHFTIHVTHDQSALSAAMLRRDNVLRSLSEHQLLPQYGHDKVLTFFGRTVCVVECADG